MSRLKLLLYRDLVKVVEAAGFEWVRCVGGHSKHVKRSCGLSN